MTSAFQASSKSNAANFHQAQPILSGGIWSNGKSTFIPAEARSSDKMQALGVGLTAVRQGVVVGTAALRRRMLVTLEINNKDRAYEWFLAWMAKQTSEQATKPSRFAPWTRSHQLSVETTVEQRKNGSSSALFKLVAGPGTHYVQYKGAWMQVINSSLFKKCPPG